jgi:hypothetical protein
VILFVMLTYVAYNLSQRAALDTASLSRGRHPFDSRATSHLQTSSGYCDHAEFDDCQLSQISNLSELEIKQRIIDGDMDFSSRVWNDMPDGMK